MLYDKAIHTARVQDERNNNVKPLFFDNDPVRHGKNEYIEGGSDRGKKVDGNVGKKKKRVIKPEIFTDKFNHALIIPY